MHWKEITLVFLAAAVVRAQETHVRGKVTYLSGGTVFTSIGTAQGAQDSVGLFVVAGFDTIAWLKVVAVSSKSSACRIDRQKREIAIGDEVSGTVVATEKEGVASEQARDTTFNEQVVRSAVPLETAARSGEKPFLSVQGRISAQYYSAMFDNKDFNFSQPGIVLNLRATSRDVPIKLDIYGNLRTFARGRTTPFSWAATNDSRIYRFSVEYDDNVNDITVGRIIPPYAPSIGSVDGVSYSRRFGSLVTGGSVGYQPPYRLQGVSTDTRKFALFAQYQVHGALDVSATGAYARTYFRSMLDREAMSFTISAYTMDGLSLYGYSDVDLRVKQGDQFNLAPAVSIASFNINYRLMEFLTVGVGADASRAVFPFSTVQSVADTLLDRSLRSGATVTVNVIFLNGVGLFNTYSPRSSQTGFGQEYMNSSSFYLNDVFSTGATVRATYMMNENSFTSARGYGLNLQKDFFGVDLTLRYQQNRYRILQLNQQNKGETLGADIMALFSRSLSLMTSFESVRGYGANSYTIFSELSLRF